jgi:hypothetical protein
MILYDMNVESWGWNRRENDGRIDHFKRIMNDQFSLESKDLSFNDLNPVGLIKLNSVVGCEPSTYYFSITAGFKYKYCTPNREVFTLP